MQDSTRGAPAAALRDEDLAGLGMDPQGDFCAFWVPGAASRSALLDVAAVRGGLAAAIDERTVLVHADPVHPVVDAVLDALRGHAVGVGVPGRGTAAAQRSLRQAAAAGQLAERTGRRVRFEQSWPLLLLLGGEDEVDELLRPAMEFARSRPELAQTVQAFSRNRFSIAATAKALYLTPNAVVYRLAKWEAGTGWDPRTYPGLTCSLSSLELLALSDARHGRLDDAWREHVQGDPLGAAAPGDRSTSSDAPRRDEHRAP